MKLIELIVVLIKLGETIIMEDLKGYYTRQTEQVI